MSKEFVVATFNIQNEYKNKNQDYKNKVEKLIKYIYDNNIECIGLQEVTDKYSNLLRDLINKEYNIYGDYRYKNSRLFKNINEGVQILSNQKVESFNTKYLSKFIFFPRIMTSLETEEFLFINVHLEFWSKYFRNKELNKLYKYIKKQKEKNIIIVGDFNVECNDKYFLNFINKLKELNINLVNNKQCTYNKKVIDYVFASNIYEVTDIVVKNDLKISDHNLLIVKFEKK